MAYRSMVSGCCFASSGRLNSPNSPVPGSVNAATALPRTPGFREPVLRERTPDFLPITYMDGCRIAASWNGKVWKQNGKLAANGRDWVSP